MSDGETRRIEVREDVVVVVQPEAHDAGRGGWLMRAIAARGPFGGRPSGVARQLGGA
jgi:hypothetical protein